MKKVKMSQTNLQTRIKLQLNILRRMIAQKSYNLVTTPKNWKLISQIKIFSCLSIMNSNRNLTHL